MSEPKMTVTMPPEFTAHNCENVAGLVQYRIDRCLEKHGSRIAALEAGGISFSISHMESVVHALNRAAKEVRSLCARKAELEAQIDDLCDRRPSPSPAAPSPRGEG